MLGETETVGPCALQPIEKISQFYLNAQLTCLEHWESLHPWRSMLNVDMVYEVDLRHLRTFMPRIPTRHALDNVFLKGTGLTFPKFKNQFSAIPRMYNPRNGNLIHKGLNVQGVNTRHDFQFVSILAPLLGAEELNKFVSSVDYLVS